MKRLHIFLFLLISVFCVQSCASSNIRKANKAAKKRYKNMNKNDDCNCAIQKRNNKHTYLYQS
ncbi:MAG: hypothetical protein R6U95_07730 [Bacteroidales bacterium]